MDFREDSMKAAGIIAEYNPFHNGHKFHIDEARKLTSADCIVAVISGSFTQRGLPACFDKWNRAAMAIDAGADLVIELPFIYACNSSMEFAAGGTGILDSLGCIDFISFGAETDDISAIVKTAEACADKEGLLETPTKERLAKGEPYGRAFSGAIGEIYGDDCKKVLDTPNNLLGVEYLKSLILRDSAIKPVPVMRKGAGHHQPIDSSACDSSADTKFASGSALRKVLAGLEDADITEYVPEEVIGRYKNAIYTPTDAVLNNMFQLLKYKISTTSVDRLSEIYSIDEGIEYRIKKFMNDSVKYGDDAFNEFLMDIKSKRYTLARLQRMMTYILMDLTQKGFNDLKGTYYARVLGFSSAGAKLLKVMTESSEIPVFSNLGQASGCDEKVAKSLEFDMRAADLYSILAGNGRIGEDKKQIPYILGMKR